MSAERWRSYKQTNNSFASIKQSSKMSVLDRQNRSREDIINRKRLKLNTFLDYNKALLKRSEKEENEQVCKAIKNLRKGNKLEMLTDLHRLFSSHQSNADQFIKHDGLQPLHSFFKTGNVDLLHTSAWCVINLTATASPAYSASLLALAPTLMQFLKGSDVIMQELCAWGLANLAGDSSSNSGVLHKQGCTDALIDVLEANHSPSEERIKSVLFALINLARSNQSCAKYMYDNDIAGKLKVLLKNLPTDSTLNYEVGWLFCSIYPLFHDASMESENLSMVTRLISDRLNHISESQDLSLKNKVCFPFVRCLCNIVGLDPLMARILLDDLRTFKTIIDLLTCGTTSLKIETISLFNNSMADVCSRVLLTLQIDLLSIIFLQCHNKETDISTQALRIVQSMARTSAYIDSCLVECGILSVLTHAVGSITSQLCNDSDEEGIIEEQLSRDSVMPLKIAVEVFMDLAISLPDVVNRKLNEEDEQRKSIIQSSFTRLARPDIQRVDTDLAHQATQLLHLWKGR